MTKDRSLSGIVDHINSGKPFGVITACSAELMKKVRDAGYGCILQQAVWTYNGELFEEQSLFIPDVNKQELMDWGKEYDQHAVLYKDNNGSIEYCCDTDEPVSFFKPCNSAEDYLKFLEESKKRSFNEMSESFELYEIQRSPALGQCVSYRRVRII
jgi:hypothetical protein